MSLRGWLLDYDARTEMHMIRVKHRGSFKRTDAFLKRAVRFSPEIILRKYGREGVAVLKAATPVDTGLTANSWDYTIEKNGRSYKLYWTNSNIVQDVSIAVVLQYGHGTSNGGFVQGVDYINPAIRPIFDDIADRAWKEVTK
jgi:hypothetical protein